MLYKIIENEPVSFVLLWRNERLPDKRRALLVGALPRVLSREGFYGFLSWT